MLHIDLVSLLLVAGAAVGGLLLWRPFRRWVNAKAHAAVNRQWDKSPDLMYDEAIRDLEKTWEQVNYLAAEAMGEVKRLENEGILLEGEVVRYHATIVSLKQQGKNDEAVLFAQQLIQARNQLAFINGDPTTGKGSALETARETARQAAERKLEVERQIAKLKMERKQVMSMHKTATAQMDLHKRLQPFGENSDRADLDKLRERIEKTAATAQGMAIMHESRIDVRIAKASISAEQQAAKDLVDSIAI